MNLCADGLDVRSNELVLLAALRLHGLVRGDVCSNQFEGHGVDLDDGSHMKVVRDEPCARDRVVLPAPLRPSAFTVTRIPLTLLPDTHRIVGEVQDNDEFSVLVFRVAVCHHSLVAKHLLLIGEHLQDISLRRPWCDLQHTRQGVLWLPVACMRGIGQLRVELWRLGDLQPTLLVAHVVAVEVPREFVAVVHDNLTVVDDHNFPNNQVLGSVEYWLGLQHARSGVDHRVLAQGFLAPEYGKRIAPRIRRKVLENFDAVVGQVVEQGVVHAVSVACWIIPEAVEAQHLSIILQELLKLGVLSVPSQCQLVKLSSLQNALRHHLRRSLKLRGCEGVLRLFLLLTRIPTQGVTVEEMRKIIAV
mmetsp:Transcript_20415/g.54665  ORF Transcript_20415/g.54665 Transcript_20415/m.54665 type:complete len:360 (+) Transcript_20415:431-1510(+)